MAGKQNKTKTKQEKISIYPVRQYDSGEELISRYYLVETTINISSIKFDFCDCLSLGTEFKSVQAVYQYSSINLSVY